MLCWIRSRSSAVDNMQVTLRGLHVQSYQQMKASLTYCRSDQRFQIPESVEGAIPRRLPIVTSG
jgi:hypothetical protein